MPRTENPIQEATRIFDECIYGLRDSAPQKVKSAAKKNDR